MNERQSRDPNRSTMNAVSVRTNFCVSGGGYDRQRTLAIRIAAITLTSDSAITIARFCPSKFSTFWGDFLTKLHSKHGEKGIKSTGENSKKSSADGTPKLQISVPCRGRTCPDYP